MRLAAGVVPSVPLTVAEVPNARKYLAIETLYGQINAPISLPSLDNLYLNVASTWFPDSRIPGPKWNANSCWFDSALHILLYLWKYNPNIWSGAQDGTLLYQLSQGLQKHWSIIEDYVGSDETERNKWKIASTAATSSRDAILELLQNYPCRERPVETTKPGVIGIPFVSIICTFRRAIRMLTSTRRTG